MIPAYDKWTAGTALSLTDFHYLLHGGYKQMQAIAGAHLSVVKQRNSWEKQSRPRMVNAHSVPLLQNGREKYSKSDEGKTEERQWPFRAFLSRKGGGLLRCVRVSSLTVRDGCVKMLRVKVCKLVWRIV